VHQNGAGNSAVSVWHHSGLQRASLWLFVFSARAAAAVERIQHAPTRRGKPTVAAISNPSPVIAAGTTRGAQGFGLLGAISPERRRDARQALSRKPGHVGAVAFSRTGDPATGDFGDAQVIREFGAVPDDLSAL
jgi:hypothetical protein